MRLTTRITLILALMFGLVFAGLSVADTRRAALEQRRFADLAVATQRAIWDDVMRERLVLIARAMAPLADRLAASRAPLGEAGTATLLGEAGTATLLGEAAREARAIDGFELQDAAGRVIYSTEPLVGTDLLIDARAIERLAAAPRPVAGLRQQRADRFAISLTVPVMRDGELAGFLTGLQDSRAALAQFAALLDTEAFLVNFRGRLVEGTDRPLWQRTEPALALREAELKVVEGDGRMFLTTAVPVFDSIDGLAGALVTMRDATADLTAIARIERATLLALVLFVATLSLAFWLYLRSAFRPIEGSIRVLDALSAGDVDVVVEEGGEAEARQLADAVSAFRASVIALRDQRAQSARRRNRQERLIRRQLQELAETLDEEGRAEIMGDLEGLFERAPRTDVTTVRGGRATADTQLVLLARVLERLSLRITDQHRRLVGLVEELREALVTRTRLAALEQELEIARALQSSFLPAPLPAEETFDLSGLMRPAREVGGDFYDFFRLGEDKLAVVVADVSGKGIPAAFFMAITRTQLRAAALDAASPAAAVARANQVLAADNEQMMFVTVFYGVLDLSTGVLAYANAGHNPPLIARSDGAVERLPPLGDPAVAVIEDIDYEEATVRLHRGDALFLYTDGVTEAFDPAGTAFGEERLEALLAGLDPGVSMAALDRRVYEAVKAFEDGADQADDITCVALRWRGARAAAAGAADEGNGRLAAAPARAG